MQFVINLLNSCCITLKEMQVDSYQAIITRLESTVKFTNGICIQLMGALYVLQDMSDRNDVAFYILKHF